MTISNASDNSANQPTLPGSLNLLGGFLANNIRQRLLVQNQSTDQVTVVLGPVPVVTGQTTVIVLQPASASGGQGGSYEDYAYRGVVAVYGVGSGDQVAIRQD